MHGYRLPWVTTSLKSYQYASIKNALTESKMLLLIQ